MLKSKNFIASLIGTIVSGLYIIALIYIIVTTWLEFYRSGLDDTRMAVEGSLYLALMLVILVTFALSLVSLIYHAKKKDLFFGQGRKILFSVIFFDFFVAFLFFILSISGVGVVAGILYAVGLILLACSGILYLVEYNEQIKFQKANRNKMDNTASQDAYYKVKEIMDRERKDE